MSVYDNSLYEQAMEFYPQPVAQACGRIRAANNSAVRLNAVLKAAETLCRYVVSLGLASLTARSSTSADRSKEIPPKIKEMHKKQLTFGVFKDALAAFAEVKTDHPLQADLTAASAGLSAIIQLKDFRNEDSHTLANLTDIRAAKILKDDEPEKYLQQALQAFQNILLNYPLFVLENVYRTDDDAYSGNLLLLMGDTSEPRPETLRLSSDVVNNRLYLGLPGGVLPLYPFMHWGVCRRKECKMLYLLQSTDKGKLQYESVEGDAADDINSTALDRLAQLLNGDPQSLKAVTLSNSQSFHLDWLERYKWLKSRHSQPVPWDDLDPFWVKWYARRLGAKSDNDRAEFQRIIAEKLLDGRDLLRAEDARQLLILLGRPEVVKQLVGRVVLDCRANNGSGEERWVERVEKTECVLSCLKEAIEFYGRHMAVGESGKTLDGLSATTGSADYIAMREGLVNLFIHQDYEDARTAGQIVIQPEQSEFINAGQALVSAQALREGGRSTARNPLISRALKLIGFAELAGSGLTQIRSSWQKAHRRPPRIESDPAANTFSITLDWRTLENPLADYWRAKIGASNLNPDQAVALVLAGQPGGVAADELSRKLGRSLEVVSYIMEGLLTNRFLEFQHNRYVLREVYRPHLAEAEQILEASRSA